MCVCVCVCASACVYVQVFIYLSANLNTCVSVGVLKAVFFTRFSQLWLRADWPEWISRDVPHLFHHTHLVVFTGETIMLSAQLDARAGGNWLFYCVNRCFTASWCSVIVLHCKFSIIWSRLEKANCMSSFWKRLVEKVWLVILSLDHRVLS